MFSKFANKDGVWSDFFAEQMRHRLNKEAVRPMGLRPGEKTPYDVVYENALLNATSDKSLNLLKAAKEADYETQVAAANKFVDYMFASVASAKVDLPIAYKYALVKAAEDVLQACGLPSSSHKYRDLIESADERDREEAEAVAAMNVPVHGLLNPRERERYLKDRAEQEQEQQGQEEPEPELPWAAEEDVIELPAAAPAPVDFGNLEAGMQHFLQKQADRNKIYNPFEEEYAEPDRASRDPAAKETRHFDKSRNPADEGVWGLDLGDEELGGMHETEILPEAQVYNIGQMRDDLAVSFEGLLERMEKYRQTVLSKENVDEVADADRELVKTLGHMGPYLSQLLSELQGRTLDPEGSGDDYPRETKPKALEASLDDLPLSLAKSKKKDSGKGNPWAICTESVGRKDKDKYERCVKKVKKKVKAALPSLPGDEALSLQQLFAEADLHSGRVPELLGEDIAPLFDRIRDELNDLQEMATKGFNTGQDLDAASDELETMRNLDDKVRDLVNQVQDVKDWYYDAKNVSYTNSTGKLPE